MNGEFFFPLAVPGIFHIGTSRSATQVCTLASAESPILPRHSPRAVIRSLSATFPPAASRRLATLIFQFLPISVCLQPSRFIRSIYICSSPLCSIDPSFFISVSASRAPLVFLWPIASDHRLPPFSLVLHRMLPFPAHCSSLPTRSSRSL